jgi:hypothetical protein
MAIVPSGGFVILDNTMARQRKPERFIGHYGCASRLVKVTTSHRIGMGANAKPPAVERVECPACGYTHLISVYWRRPLDPAEDERAELEFVR